MMQFLMEAGPFIWPIILLAGLIGFLVLWNVFFLSIPPGRSIPARRKSIDAVLFWGGVAAILGFLGQWMGIHKMTGVIAAHGIVSPRAVVYGLSESLLTPLSGMVVFVGAALLWSLLRVGLWSIERRA